MKRKSYLALLTVLGFCSTTSLASCNNTSSNLGDYVYNTYISTNPKTWNTHNWETSDESYITSYTEMGLYDTILNSTKDGYEIVTEMAAEMPIAVDPSTIDDDTLSKFYSGNVGENLIWDIKLNQNAKWQDGTAITADDYVESMKLQLDPKYANYRADSYYNGNLVIANAEDYFKSGRSTVESAYNHVDKTNGDFDENSCQDDVYYLNIGRENDWVKNIFKDASGSSESTSNLYLLFQQDMVTNVAANNLAASRITDAVKSFLLQGYSNTSYYAKHQGYYDEHKSDWEKAKEEGANSVSKDMLENHPDIDFEEFDSNKIYVRTDANNSSITGTNADEYSKAKLIADMNTIVTGLGKYGITAKWGATEGYKIMSYVSVYNTSTKTWDNVGLVKVDDYTIRFYLAKEITDLNLKFALSSNWLVKTDLYEKLTTTQANKTKQTSYATNSIDNYMAYGPYKLSKYESGKTINLVKNENWYGWTDGNHVGQFQMTGLNTEIITDHTTAMMLFKQGKLDDIDLTADDMKDFGNSGRLTTVYESYTTKVSFNSDRSKLLDRQTSMGAGNKTILSNTDFRRGLSLALNRKDFASQATAGSKAFTGLLNDLYLSDVEHGKKYRDTEQGKSVYNQVYGKLGGTTIGEDKALPESSYGYNQALAIEYVAKAFQDEFDSTEAGHLTQNDKIAIEFRVYDNTSANTIAANTRLNEYWKSVVTGANAKLGSNVSIEVSTVKDENYYDSAKNGNYDMIFSIWGGAQINPYGLMEVYCKSEFASCCEYGFKGKQDQVLLDIDLNGDGVIGDGETKSFETWYTEMDSATSTDKKLTILAGLEAGIISRFEAIPIVARGTSSLTSFKVEQGSSNYVSLVGYGGIRFMTFNYTNSGWNDFVNKQGGDLSTLYKNAEE